MILSPLQEILYFKIPNDLDTLNTYKFYILNIEIQFGEALTNDIKIKLFKNQNLEEEKVINLGSLNCNSITDYNFKTNLPKRNFKGATYILEWKNTQLYRNPKISFIFPISSYSFDPAKNYNIKIYIDDNQFSKTEIIESISANTIELFLQNLVLEA